MSAPMVWVEGVGVLGPGLTSWAQAQDVLRGTQPYVCTPTVLPPPARLPPAERRRAGFGVKLAMAVADEAVQQAQRDPGQLATVFTSSNGDGETCHALCETLATPSPMVSPTRFTNSVHNAASGAWHIAVGSRAPSTSLCAFDGSFGVGLVEAATSVRLGGQPVLLVAFESPYPEPLNTARPLPDHFGVALLLAPAPGPRSLAALTIALEPPPPATARLADVALDRLCHAVPAAAALPLLAVLAEGRQRQGLVLDCLPYMALRIDVAPMA